MRFAPLRFSVFHCCGFACLSLWPTLLPAGPLASVLKAVIDHHGATGLVAMVADKEKVLDVEAIGEADLVTHRPEREDDMFWIASMTKSFTATAFMMLVDEGKVDINDPVEKYLPEFKGQQVADDKERKQLRLPAHPITIREVFSHTSGICIPQDPAVKHTGVLKDEVAQYGAIPLLREPGTKFEYNNTGIDTAGRIIEVISGKSYADFIQERLLTPLGMKDTTFWPNEEQGKRLSRSSRFTADNSGLENIDFAKDFTASAIERMSKGIVVPHEVLVNFGMGKISEYTVRAAEPAGALFSTAADVTKFCQMLLRGGEYGGKRYLSVKAISQMTTGQTGDVSVNPMETYGLGWFVKKVPHEGLTPGAYGHRGARRTVMWVDPTQGLTFVIMLQRMDMTGDQQKELYEGFMKAAAERYGRPTK